MQVRVHRVEIERWTEFDEKTGQERTFSHINHHIGVEERPRRSTLRPTKLQRAKARYAPQSLRAPAGDTLFWAQDSDGTVRLARPSEARAARKATRPRMSPTVAFLLSLAARSGFDWPSAGNPRP